VPAIGTLQVDLEPADNLYFVRVVLDLVLPMETLAFVEGAYGPLHMHWVTGMMHCPHRVKFVEMNSTGVLERL
jgi:hypothetical protein